MRSNRKHKLAAIAVTAILAARPASTWACATCFGQSDSSLAKGATLGIVFLLAVILSLLGGIGVFFIAVARRAASASANESDPSSPKS